jgi:hypothetical protein
LATKAKQPEQPMKVIGPRSKKQEMYIQSEADVVVFGGGKETSAANKLC